MRDVPSTSVLPSRSGNRINAAGVEWMTTRHPPHRQPRAARSTVRGNRVGSILRTSRMETTGGGKQRRENPAIDGNRKENSRHGETVAGSFHLIVTSFDDQSIFAGSPASSRVRSISAVASTEVTAGSDPLAIRTTHRSGLFHFSVMFRAASRSNRLARFRFTAPPTRRLATTPIRRPSSSGF